MCYNVNQEFSEEEAKALEEEYGVDAKYLSRGSSPHIHRYLLKGFAHPKLIVLADNEPSKLQEFNWGLIPFWTKTSEQADDIAKKTLNAKSETIFKLPSFRSPIKKKRCLIPVAGFYEWMDHKGKKYPHYIYPKVRPFFTLGGIWEEWTDKETGEIRKTASIITTAANPIMAKIHNSKKRMPLILQDDIALDWISPELKEEDIASLMNPYDQKKMAFHTISKLITSRNENPNVEEVMEPVEYPELSEELYV
ncbi:SOS response-associated peptidase [Echinicola sp. 20G]|uniref:SOS response-associated peptidase n=1 Tax=Echinicola sp. 20G TaxID=2781961 RepID=UPI00190FCBD1|nr:SOS response-associated peptidase [Echinicola sp. 20G]